MGHIFKSLLLNDLGSIGNQCVYFYPLNIEHAKLPSLEKEGWHAVPGWFDSNPKSAIPNPKCPP
jgi:hypothetical protein